MAGRVAPETSRLDRIREAVVFLWQTDRRWRAMLAAAGLATALVVALPPSDEEMADVPSPATPGFGAEPLDTDSPAAPTEPVPEPGRVERLAPAAPLEGGAIVVDPDQGFATAPEKGRATP